MTIGLMGPIVGAEFGPLTSTVGARPNRNRAGLSNSSTTGYDPALVANPPGRIALNMFTYGTPPASVPDALAKVTPAGSPGNNTATWRPKPAPMLRTSSSAVYRPVRESTRILLTVRSTSTVAVNVERSRGPAGSSTNRGLSKTGFSTSSGSTVLEIEPSVTVVPLSASLLISCTNNCACVR